MRIVYTKHLRFRLKVRMIPFDLPRIVVLEAEEFFFDTVTKTFIAVKKFIRTQGAKEYMVAYMQHENILELITIHPLRFRQKSNRIVTKRWQRIRKIL